MPKKKVNQTKREMTQRQMSHWQVENRRQRIILLAGIVLIVAILAVVGTGLFMNQYQPYHVTVIKVGDTEYDMDYYINTLAFYGIQYGSIQMIPVLADTVDENIAQNQIYIEEAAKLNPPVIVSDSDVQKYIEDNKLSADPTRVDAVRAILTVQKLQSDYFPQQVPESAEHRNVQAMFLASQSQVDAVKARLDKGESFSDLAAELSLEKTSKDNKGDFGWVPQGILSNILNKGNGNTTVGNNALENHVFTTDTSIEGLSSVEDTDQLKDLGYWLVKVTETRKVNATPTPSGTDTPTPNPEPTSTTQAHVFTMLLGSEQRAQDIKAKLEQGGEGNDWTTLAITNSLDDQSSSGGDRGFVSKGALGEAIDQIIFPEGASQAIEVNKISDPIPDSTQSTTGGFWLVRVGEINTQGIVDTHRTFLAQNLLRDWLKKVWEDNQSRVQNLLTDEQRTFAIEQAQKR